MLGVNKRVASQGSKALKVNALAVLVECCVPMAVFLDIHAYQVVPFCQA